MCTALAAALLFPLVFIIVEITANVANEKEKKIRATNEERMMKIITAERVSENKKEQKSTYIIYYIFYTYDGIWYI